ncbi:YbcC family protein [Arenimonas fontis]|uniref:Probable inorganic carbon transporter subunit DabA n=1 Tax=Arenimonas fontis TaxID=2608255 RepID=A0A5B2Z7M2_9GAMM|nr:DUF2309 domain-containing protein [Arenimonas fontis]KAA2283897.1 DUF2309 domain-containing protein [Arenimonas fontis]
MTMIATPAPMADAQTVARAVEQAVRSIPPLWPLASSVAVNPFLGQAGEALPSAAARLARVAGIALTMPRAWYAERIRSGQITEADLAAAIAATPRSTSPLTVESLRQAAAGERPAPVALPTVAELAADISGVDWPGLIDERVGHFAASYFDQGQALWAMPRARGAYATWRSVAMHDLTPEIAGLKGFASSVEAWPESPEAGTLAAVERLGLGEAALVGYFHRLLMSLGGWAQLARHRLWQAELAGGTDATVTDLLAIRLTWETALLERYQPAILPRWRAAVAAYARPLAPSADDEIDATLQEAAERSAQRRLQEVLAGSPSAPAAPSGRRPALQVAFCIDVRSEVFRRALEGLDAGIQTLGFAGFFGLGIAHRRFASDVVESRLPVLLKPGLTTCSGKPTPDVEAADLAARIAARARRAWGRFKLAAISSFAFVEAMGPVYVGKLLRDGLRLAGNRAPAEPPPRFDHPVPDLGTRVDMAERVLRAMSLTDGFARLVLLAGHGAGVVNNPHASALQCGACGGYSGEVNARLLAGLLNDTDVRAALAGRGIAVPDDTLFLGALHDTTTDAVTLFDDDHSARSHVQDLRQARSWLLAAGALARAERARRLPRASGAGDIARRARDWAEVRPEWALAGCQAFIAAPRYRTEGRDLQGRIFLHDYQWRRDEDFAVLELILTAPVVVASWISLQYYGSAVAPDVFGAGNKLLHNVIGGIGVVEGNGGLLRGGLPWQSVHDGERLVHEPLRMSVLLEAPREAITAVLDRHPEVRALFDNRWLHLFALDDHGRMAWRYGGNSGWERMRGD